MNWVESKLGFCLPFCCYFAFTAPDWFASAQRFNYCCRSGLLLPSVLGGSAAVVSIPLLSCLICCYCYCYYFLPSSFPFIAFAAVIGLALLAITLRRPSSVARCPLSLSSVVRFQGGDDQGVARAGRSGNGLARRGAEL